VLPRRHSTRKFNLRKEPLTKARFNEARVRVAWTMHAIRESNYSRSLISFRFPARCILSRDKFSPISQLLEAERVGRSSPFFSHSRCDARVVPVPHPASRWFIFLPPWRRTPRICMVQYRTFLGGQLRESILGPIGSRVGPYRTGRATRASDVAVRGRPFPLSVIHCERAR